MTKNITWTKNQNRNLKNTLDLDSFGLASILHGARLLLTGVPLAVVKTDVSRDELFKKRNSEPRVDIEIKGSMFDT